MNGPSSGMPSLVSTSVPATTVSALCTAGLYPKGRSTSTLRLSRVMYTPLG